MLLPVSAIILFKEPVESSLNLLLMWLRRASGLRRADVGGTAAGGAAVVGCSALSYGFS